MLALLALVALPVDADTGEIPVTDGVCDIVTDRGLHLCPPTARALSKKALWLTEKAHRPDIHVTDDDLRPAPASRRAPRPARGAALAAATTVSPPRPGTRQEPITTLYNVWTHETLPILPGESFEPRFHPFLRDHFTNQATHMDTRLIDVLVRVAQKFSAAKVEVVSGYRSPKYNLMLRKKGHQVARESQHVEGHAVDFRIPRLPTKTLLNYVRSLHVGGVGFYPHSAFVHSDTGRIRFWTGS